jgi:hypothetical protein
MKDLLKQASTLLQEKYRSAFKEGEIILLETHAEDGVIKLRALVGTQKRAHEFELKCEIKNPHDDKDVLLLLLDFFDEALGEFFRRSRKAGFGLDFAKRRFEGVDLFVRQEYRDFEAERLADELLQTADSKNHSKFD